MYKYSFFFADSCGSPFSASSFADKRIWSDKPEENFPKSAKTL